MPSFFCTLFTFLKNIFAYYHHKHYNLRSWITVCAKKLRDINILYKYSEVLYKNVVIFCKITEDNYANPLVKQLQFKYI